ncbi:hypothetical protein ACFC77_44350, partial [Nocardia colli]
ASEQLVIVAERGPGAGKADPLPIADEVRAAVASRHGVTVRDVLLVPAGSIPRTSSGKIARRACRKRYLNAAFWPTGPFVGVKFTASSQMNCAVADDF